MNVLGAVAVAVLGATWIAWFLLMIAYVLIAAFWRAAHERATERSALRALVFHSLAGIVLSFPGMILALGGGVEGTSSEVSWILAAALLACWALALASCARRRVPPSLAWFPLAVTAACLAIFVSQAMRSGSSGIVLVLMTYVGVGVIGWILVSINFALAVRKYDRYQLPTRAFARYSPYAASLPVHLSPASAMK